MGNLQSNTECDLKVSEVCKTEYTKKYIKCKGTAQKRKTNDDAHWQHGDSVEKFVEIIRDDWNALPEVMFSHGKFMRTLKHKINTKSDNKEMEANFVFLGIPKTVNKMLLSKYAKTPGALPAHITERLNELSNYYCDKPTELNNTVNPKSFKNHINNFVFEPNSESGWDPSYDLHKGKEKVERIMAGNGAVLCLTKGINSPKYMIRHMYSHANNKQEQGQRTAQWWSKDSILHTESVCHEHIGVSLWKNTMLKSTSVHCQELINNILKNATYIGVSVLRRTWETAFLILSVACGNINISEEKYDKPSVFNRKQPQNEGVVQIPYIREITNVYGLFDLDQSNQAFQFGEMDPLKRRVN